MQSGPVFVILALALLEGTTANKLSRGTTTYTPTYGKSKGRTGYAINPCYRIGTIESDRDALIVGEWRTANELEIASGDNIRNTLIVELNKCIGLDIKDLQAKPSTGRIGSLNGIAAIYIYLRDMKIRSEADLKTMNNYDQRNVLIEFLNLKLNLPQETLKAKDDLYLVLLGDAAFGCGH